MCEDQKEIIMLLSVEKEPVLSTVLSFLDANSAVSLVSSTKKLWTDDKAWRALVDMKHIPVIDERKTLRSHALDVTTRISKNYFCKMCDYPLDSIYGLFLFSEKCFDCKLNQLAHEDPYNQRVCGQDWDNNYRNDISDWRDRKISGTHVLNAFGTHLGHGTYFIFNRAGHLVKDGSLVALAKEMQLEEDYLRQHAPFSSAGPPFENKNTVLRTMQKKHFDAMRPAWVFFCGVFAAIAGTNPNPNPMLPGGDDSKASFPVVQFFPELDLQLWLNGKVMRENTGSYDTYYETKSSLGDTEACADLHCIVPWSSVISTAQKYASCQSHPFFPIEQTNIIVDPSARAAHPCVDKAVSTITSNAAKAYLQMVRPNKNNSTTVGDTDECVEQEIVYTPLSRVSLSPTPAECQIRAYLTPLDDSDDDVPVLESRESDSSGTDEFSEGFEIFSPVPSVQSPFLRSGGLPGFGASAEECEQEQPSIEISCLREALALLDFEAKALLSLPQETAMPETLYSNYDQVLERTKLMYFPRNHLVGGYLLVRSRGELDHLQAAFPSLVELLPQIFRLL
jgi:hypothetical protein